MLGLYVLIVVVVVAIIGTVVAGARAGATGGRTRAARIRVRAALGKGLAETEAARRVRGIAAEVPSLAAPRAAALVLAARETGSRHVAPLLTAALRHRDGAVSAAAAAALNDLGAVGLRCVWRLLDADPMATGTAALRVFVVSHPDWLFERLVSAFAEGGGAAVRRHAGLWRDPGMQARLALLESGSDAVNAVRARAIRQALASAAGQVA